MYHLQKAHPDAGEFRIWVLAQPDISARTVGRIMALNKLVYDDIPMCRSAGASRPRSPIPIRLSSHEYWFIDGRQMDFASTVSSGGAFSSSKVFPHHSRGAMAPTEATWAALMVLYTACRRYGAPTCLVSDSGGAYTSDAFVRLWAAPRSTIRRLSVPRGKAI